MRAVDSDGIIHTVAGTGSPGYSGDGGPATQAQVGIEGSTGNDCMSHGCWLTQTSQLAVDPNGAVYTADGATGRVRRIAPDGTITTFAGNGTRTYSGDGAPAVRAGLVEPEGLAFDANGDLLVADTGDNRIRKIAPDGTISTFAGTGAAGYAGDLGPATAAQLNSPEALAVANNGDVYVADTYNNAIRRITPDGKITTFAGGNNIGPAGACVAPQVRKTLVCLEWPSGLAVDATGNVFIADTWDQRVIQITPRRAVRAVAGNGSAGNSGDGGPATSAELQAPTALTLDQAGNLYIADLGNNKVRVVNRAGTISTVAGTGTYGYGGDGEAATAAQLISPSGLAMLGDALLIADGGNKRVRVVR